LKSTLSHPFPESTIHIAAYMTSTTRSSFDSLDYTTENKPMGAPAWAKPRSTSVISQTLVPPPVQESHLRTKLINAAYIAMNTFSTVAIVFLNKVYVDMLSLDIWRNCTDNHPASS